LRLVGGGQRDAVVEESVRLRDDVGELDRLDRGRDERRPAKVDQDRDAVLALAPPRDALEEEPLGICRELLGSRAIDGMEGSDGSERMGIGDDFFALGGDSFTAVRLLARVEERWGRRDLSSFFLEPTVFHLAGLVRAPRADQETYDD